MGLASLESLLSERIEGFFNRKFASMIEPAELTRALERELARSKRKTEEGVFVPNEYTVQLGEEDYQRLCAQRVIRSLYETVERWVIREDCLIDGTLQIRMGKRVGEKGIVDIISEDSTARSTDAVEPHTLVLERKNFDAPLNLPEEHEIATLCVEEGPDAGAGLTLGCRQIYIGRRDKSDFILTDSNVSRMHAYISYERHRHVLHDAGSLNGTYVNGTRESSVMLCGGDRIQMGSSMLAYEVV